MTCLQVFALLSQSAAVAMLNLIQPSLHKQLSIDNETDV